MSKDIPFCKFPDVYLTAWMTIDTEITGVNLGTVNVNPCHYPSGDRIVFGHIRHYMSIIAFLYLFNRLVEVMYYSNAG